MLQDRPTARSFGRSSALAPLNFRRNIKSAILRGCCLLHCNTEIMVDGVLRGAARVKVDACSRAQVSAHQEGQDAVAAEGAHGLSAPPDQLQMSTDCPLTHRHPMILRYAPRISRFSSSCLARPTAADRQLLAVHRCADSTAVRLQRHRCTAPCIKSCRIQTSPAPGHRKPGRARHRQHARMHRMTLHA